jgi:uncharacterized protein YdcH (DUF465 family)
MILKLKREGEKFHREFHKLYSLDDQIKGDKMGGTRSTSEEDVNSYKVSLSKTQTEQTN